MPTAPISYGLDEPGDQILIRAVKQYVSTRLAEPARLDELARALGVSKKRISAAFRERLGVSVAEFVRAERMRTAQRLLTQSSLGVQAIAETLGFSSAANFSTAFREHVGMSPTAFRSSAPLESITTLQGSLSWNSPTS